MTEDLEIDEDEIKIELASNKQWLYSPWGDVRFSYCGSGCLDQLELDDGSTFKLYTIYSLYQW